MHVHILGPNLRTQTETFHVHAGGCADVQRSPLYRGIDHTYERTNTENVESMRDVVEYMYADQIAEHDGPGGDPVWHDWHAYASDFKVFPCVRGLPDEPPGETPSPAPVTVVDRLTDGALAERLRMLARNVRTFTAAERKLFLMEAASRLSPEEV